MKFPWKASKQTQWIIVVLLTALYGIGSFLFVKPLGISIIAISIFPIAFVGWYFGVTAGIGSGILVSLFNLWFIINIAGLRWDELKHSGFPPGTFFLILTGLVTGLVKKELEKRLQAEEQLTAREKFATMLNEMTRAVMTSQNMNEMLTSLAVDVTLLLNADHCYVTRWDPVLKKTTPLATSVIFDSPYTEMTFPIGERTLTQSVMEAEKSIAVEDVFNSPHLSAKLAAEFPAKSLAGVPLIYNGHKLGAVLIGYKEHHTFSPEEIYRAEQAGNQIALALWNIQQDQELKRQLRELDALAKISTALSRTEQLGLSNVLQLIVNSAKELIPSVEQAVIHLLDDEEIFLIPEALIGYDNPEAGRRKMRIGEGVAGQALKRQELISIADVTTDPRFIVLNTKSIIRSLIVLPIVKGRENLGTLSVQSRIPNAFTADDGKLLTALGVQAAIAIENAHLLDTTRQALKEANALYQVNQGVVDSLDPDEVLKDTVELLQKNFDYYYVQVFVADPDSGDFVMRAGSGEIGEKLKKQNHRLARGEGIVGYTAETGTAFFTNSVDELVSFTRHPLLPDTQSELAMPVKVGNEILGLLDIHQIPPRSLSQRDIQLVSAVADQLAIALQKATLYEELQISLQQEKAVRNQLVQNERLAVMGRLLASVSHELNNPLQAIQNALFLLREEKGISQQGLQDLNIVLAESERMADMIERLRATYRPIQAEDFRQTQINNIVEDVFALIATHLRHNEIDFTFNPDPGLPTIPALTDQIRQVILNLMMNAVEAMTTGGKLEVCTKYLRENEEVEIVVTDTGTGIHETILPHIFDAFVTNKDRGTGLGLTITYDIISKHRGRIIAQNNPDKGATFKVWLPLENREII
jgi:signal transduction histidine kinase